MVNARSIMGGIMALVMVVIGFTVIQGVLANTTWTSSIATTVSDYIVPVGLVGALVVAGTLALGRN